MVNNAINNNMVKLSLKEKILKYLIENKSPVSILQMSNHLNTDYKNTFESIKNLSQVIKNKVGNTNLVEINLFPNQEIYAVEDKRTEQFLRENKNLILIKKDIESIAYPFMIVLAFGSYVRKNQNKKSDVDICIISDNSSKTKELISKLNLLPLKLEIQEFNIKEFESMLETKRENVAKEIVKRNILLFGADNYYNLISKWTKKE